MEKSHTLQILWESDSNIGKFDIALKEWGKLQIPTFRLYAYIKDLSAKRRSNRLQKIFLDNKKFVFGCQEAPDHSCNFDGYFEGGHHYSGEEKSDEFHYTKTADTERTVRPVNVHKHPHPTDETRAHFHHLLKT